MYVSLTSNQDFATWPLRPDCSQTDAQAIGLCSRTEANTRLYEALLGNQLRLISHGTEIKQFESTQSKLQNWRSAQVDKCQLTCGIALGQLMS